MKKDLAERLKALSDKVRRVKALVNGPKFGEAEHQRVKQLLNSIDEGRLGEGVVPEDAFEPPPPPPGDGDPDAPPPVGPGQGPGGN